MRSVLMLMCVWARSDDTKNGMCERSPCMSRTVSREIHAESRVQMAGAKRARLIPVNMDATRMVNSVRLVATTKISCSGECSAG